MDFDFLFDIASFNEWNLSERGDNSQDLRKSILALRIAINEYTTEKQRTYMLEYFKGQMTTEEIAELHGINQSTVSRTIRRGIENIYKCIRFTSPQFLEAPLNRNKLKNGRRRKGGTHGKEQRNPNHAGCS